MADVSIEPIMAAITFLRPRFNNTKSCMPIASPIPIMGPISGEISIAPIITGILLVLSPSDAMNIANINTISCEPLNETPLLMLCSASNCGSRSSATLKYDLTSIQNFFQPVFTVDFNSMTLFIWVNLIASHICVLQILTQKYKL